jgi:hypothetical protein
MEESSSRERGEHNATFYGGIRLSNNPFLLAKFSNEAEF